MNVPSKFNIVAIPVNTIFDLNVETAFPTSVFLKSENCSPLDVWKLFEHCFAKVAAVFIEYYTNFSL